MGLGLGAECEGHKLYMHIKSYIIQRTIIKKNTQNLSHRNKTLLIFLFIFIQYVFLGSFLELYYMHNFIYPLFFTFNIVNDSLRA